MLWLNFWNAALCDVTKRADGSYYERRLAPMQPLDVAKHEHSETKSEEVKGKKVKARPEDQTQQRHHLTASVHSAFLPCFSAALEPSSGLLLARCNNNNNLALQNIHLQFAYISVWTGDRVTEITCGYELLTLGQLPCKYPVAADSTVSVTQRPLAFSMSARYRPQHSLTVGLIPPAQPIETRAGLV